MADFSLLQIQMRRDPDAYRDDFFVRVVLLRCVRHAPSGVVDCVASLLSEDARK